MSKTNYQLSAQYEIIEDSHLLAERGYGSVVLCHKPKDHYLLLNPMITNFLKAFQQPTTLKNVALMFQKGTNDSLKEIIAALRPFFNAMCDRQIIKPFKAQPEPLKPDMPNGEGLHYGHYTLQQRLSCKPPIDIYVATNDEGQKVILKRLLFAPDFPEKYRSEYRKNFAQEFKMLKILRGCPNICPLISFEKKQDYAVIAYFEGATLQDWVEKKADKGIEVRLSIFKQILQTAAFMHSFEVLHGDWHYKNVLINDENVVKIIDFNLALLDGQRQKRGILRGGIKEFIPPERIDDSAFEVTSTPPDYHAEVFQIGVLAYYLLVGDYPFKGETWKKLAFAIQNHAPNWGNTQLPNEIIEFLNKALAKNPNARFDSAINMWAEWQNLERVFSSK